MMILQMLQDASLADNSEEQTEIISADPTKETHSSNHTFKSNKYSPAQISTKTKIPIIMLLLILMFYVIFSLLNATVLIDYDQKEEIKVKVNTFKKQQEISTKTLPIFHVVQQRNHSQLLQQARDHYIQAKQKMTQLSKIQEIDEIDNILKAKYDFQTLLASAHPDPSTLQLIQNGRTQSKFILPKIVWTYMTSPLESQSYINFLTITNNIRIARNADFTLNFLTKDNYDHYLNADAANQLKQAIKEIHMTKKEQAIEILIKYLIVTTVLEELGGIFVEEYVSLLEGFEWLEDIGNNIFVNRGARNVAAQVFGFYSVQHSSPLQRQQKPQIVKVKQYMRLFPAVQHYFLAARPHAIFLKDLKAQLYHNIKKNDSELRIMARELHDNKKAYKLDIKTYNLWQDLFIISSQRVLVREHQRLMKSGSNLAFAIDSYGLKTINEFYFPYKLEFVFSKYQFEKTFSHLARHTLQEFETTVGPMRYVAVITPRNQIDNLLNNARQGIFKHTMISGSFLQIYLFNNTQEKFIVANPEIPFVKVDPPKWIKLPKIIWLFWDKGFGNSHATNQLAKRNIEKYAAISGFKVIQVNKTNLKDYIGLAQIQKIDQAMYFNNRGSKFDQTYSDLVRLALLIKHGGVYMDAAFMLLQDLSWLIDIASYPSQFVFNRYGELPSVFMFFNPHYGSQYDEWQVDTKYNTKAHWHLSYQNNFIACQAKNQLIIAWFDTLINYLTQPYSQTEKQFKQCGIYSHKWSSQENTYLLPMDTIKCIIGKKEIQLKKQNNREAFSPASQYYKLWSISGYNGVQKFRGFTNFQNPGSDDNLFFRRYSQHYVSSLLGKPREVIKLYSINNINLNDFIRDNLEDHIFHQIHHQSFFNRYLFSMREEDEDFIIVNYNLLIKEKKKLN